MGSPGGSAAVVLMMIGGYLDDLINGFGNLFFPNRVVFHLLVYNFKNNYYLFCFFVAPLLVSIELSLPMFHLTFSSAVINSVTSVTCIEFVL